MHTTGRVLTISGAVMSAGYAQINISPGFGWYFNAIHFFKVATL